MKKTFLLVGLLLFLPQFAIAAGTQTYSTSGTYIFTVPAYGSLTVTVWGGGGGGVSSDHVEGSSGGQSRFNSSPAMIANGGSSGTNGSGGAGGTSSGGTTNTTGNTGRPQKVDVDTGSYNPSFSFGCQGGGGNGGSAPSGGAGGSGGYSSANDSGGWGTAGSSGAAPGAGGGGGGDQTNFQEESIDLSYCQTFGGGGGGSGGYTAKTFLAGGLTVGAGISVTVGSGGSKGNGSTYDGGTGANGRVTITWTDPAPTVTTRAATSVTQTSAILQGTGDPNNVSTTGWFRFRTTNPGSCNDTFGTRVPSSGGTALGSGSTGVNYSRAISGLTQNKTYYYCAIASNSAGKGYGTVRSFTTTAAAPTCSITISPSTVNQGSSATLSYSSSNASWFYISGISYVTPNISGSTSVSPSQTTTYSGSVSGPGGTATCTGNTSPPGTLTVNQSCTFNGQTITHGSSVTAYQSATVPYGSSCSSQTRTCSNGTLSGSYQYASCAVGAPSSCTQGGVTVAHGSSHVFYSIQTAPSGETCSGGSYSQSRTCTNGTLSGSATYQYGSCSCVPTTVYSCSPANVIRTVTSSSCTVTVTNPYATCTSPAFCSAGSSTCLSPDPDFEPGAGGTGHLEVRPGIVRAGNTTRVFWNVTNVTSCTVAGDNGDIWTVTGNAGNDWTSSSGTSGRLSAPITQRTTYTLTCTALAGVTPPTLIEAVDVLITPVFQEV